MVGFIEAETDNARTKGQEDIQIIMEIRHCKYRIAQNGKWLEMENDRLGNNAKGMREQY
jgi:hypothetical protein